MMNSPTGEIFRGVFEAYPDGVLLVDGQGGVVLANGAAAELLGYSVQALQRMSVDALVPDSVASRHAAHRHAYAQAPRARPMGSALELKAKCADGSEVMIEIALSPLRANGHDYVVAAMRGIAAYPRVKRALQRARYSEFGVQLGRLAVDTLDPEALLQRVPATVQEALDVDAVTVHLLTPNRLELRVASASGMDAQRAARVAHPNRPETVLGYAVTLRAPLVITDFEHDRRFDAPTHLLETAPKSGIVVPLVDRARIIGVLAAWSKQPHQFGEDEVAFMVSLANLLSTSLQRAQAEAQLRHAQRMETIGQLTGGVAHDFNNLLTVILGNLQLLADQPAVDGDALCRQLVAAASRAGRRGADLTGKLLAFARRMTLEPTAVDPIAVLHALADMLRRTLGENIRVVVQTPPRCPRCLVDVVQLESALLNVAVNARDAMPGGGTLVLRCGAGGPRDVGEPATIPGALDGDSAGQPHDWVWLSVQDNGSGMSQEVRERAFEPFFTTKDVGRGTGLGLSTVYGFIKQSQGHIELDSAPLLGTTVTMYLPGLDDGKDAAVADPGADAATAAALPPGLQVLLVEDDPDVRTVAQAFLQSMACEVVACASGEAAWAELGKPAGGRAFDLLFSDIMLGAGIDGQELARRVSARYPALVVLLTSGYSRHLAQVNTGEPPSRWPILKKPYSRRDLALTIAKCLAGRAG